MYLLMLVVFVIGYFLIAVEHSIKIDKAASAVLTGVLCWTVLIFGKDVIFADMAAHGGERAGDLLHFLDESLLEHLGEISEILFSFWEP
jgi:hypothetical protein